MRAKADQADPALISYVEWPCICGRWPLFGSLIHRLVSGCKFSRACGIDETGHLVDRDGAAGVHYKEVKGTW